MDFMSIGSLNSYIKNTAMQQKWQAKQKSGNFTADGKKTIGEWIDSQTKTGNSANGIGGNSSGDTKLAGIRSKLANGQKLDISERQYLKDKDPVTYKKLEEAEAEEKKFKEELQKCKTKDEVQRLKFNHISASLSIVKSVENNPNIPEGAKLGIIAGEQAKVKMISDATDRFVQSGRYADLPTDAEKREAEKILKEAEEAKLHPENAEDTSDTKENNAPVAENISNEAEKNTDSTKQSDAANAEKTVKTADNAAAEKNIIPDKKVTKADAEQSPEVKKVKRSKNHYDDTNNTSQGVTVADSPSFEAKA